MTFAKTLATAAALVMAAAAVQAQEAANPAVIFDLGGKFDRSFNQASFEGAERFTKETGIAYEEFELQNDAQREQALRRFAERGHNPVVTAGFSYASAMETVAPEFPDTDFVVIDAVVEQPNVRSVVFNEHEGSYLVGVLAALASKTGKVGFVGGMDIPLIQKFACGYVQGVKATNPDAEVFQNMTGTTGAAWNDPVRGGELAKSQIDRGADVVYHAAGGTGIGVLQAAADAGALGIGVDFEPELPASRPGADLDAEARRPRHLQRDDGRPQRHLHPRRPGDGPRRGRRRLGARRQQQGADHAGDAGGRRRGPGQDHLGRDQGARLHRPTGPARSPDGDARPVTERGGGREPAARHRAGRHLQELRPGPGQPRHPPRRPPRHHPRHRRRERRRQVDADVDPLRLLPGRRRRDPHRGHARRRSRTAWRRSAPASAWCTSTSCWSSRSPCSRTSSSAPRTARSCAPRSPRRGRS